MSGRRNRRAPEFKKLFAALPAHIQDHAREAFQRFVADASHLALRHHALKDNDRGRHRAGSFSVSVTRSYRAIYYIVEEQNVWYWIGTHADYDKFTGHK
ncbi:MAG: hypothetical protein SGJ19_27545 [Planctomycetia bacterium]|nr:hypothetical protein [Planctomycetia bacterium]